MSLGSWTCRYSYSSSEYLSVFNPCSHIQEFWFLGGGKMFTLLNSGLSQWTPWVYPSLPSLKDGVSYSSYLYRYPLWRVRAQVWLQMGDGGYNCRCDACVDWSNYQPKKQRTKKIERTIPKLGESWEWYALFLARQTAPYLGYSFASNGSLDYWNWVSTTDLIKSGWGSRS